jgi:hypothetical protein
LAPHKFRKQTFGIIAVREIMPVSAMIADDEVIAQQRRHGHRDILLPDAGMSCPGDFTLRVQLKKILLEPPDE